VSGLAFVAFCTSFLSLVVLDSSHLAILFSGILGILIAPYAAYQQRKITRTETLRHKSEQMMIEINTLEAENDRLQLQLDEMQQVASRLESLQTTLEAIQALKAASVPELEERLIQESRRILDEMRNHKASLLLRSIMEVLVSIDLDSGNLILGDSEIDDLMDNLNTISELQKEDDLRQMILDNGRSVRSILAVARRLTVDEAPEDRNVKLFNIDYEIKTKHSRMMLCRHK